MKKVIGFIGLFLFGIAGMSYAQSVQVFYEEQLKMGEMSLNIDGIDDPAIMELIKSQLSSPTTAMALYYHAGESLYETFSTEKQDENSFEKSGVQIHIIEIGETNKIYKNHKTKQAVAQRNILDRNFLITEPFTDFDWQILPEEKEIAGYRCKKAISNNEITAWFVPEININDGPDVYYGLPGLILEIESENKIITATSVDLLAETATLVKAPSKGKKISQQDFDTLKRKHEEKIVPSSDESDVKINIIRQ